jgi:hypothetical protein
MQVRVRILFKPPTEEDWQAMRSLAKSLTKQPESVRVFADTNPEWLVAEFTMPTEAQYKAEPKISMAIRLHAWNRHDVTFGFPYTAAERARADRKAARRKARRAAKRNTNG